MKRIVFALLLLAIPALALDEPTRPVLVTLKYTDPQSLFSLLEVYGINFRINREMKVVALSGAPDRVDAAVAMLKQLDVPPRDIDLSIYYMVGSEAENTLGTAPPKELEAVVTQLKNAFTFKNYRLLDVLSLRTRTGEQVASTSELGTLTQSNGIPSPIIGNFQIRSATMAPDGSTVRLDGMRNSLRWPSANNGYMDLNLNTDIDIKEAQKVVVGRLGVSHDQAVFLVITAKIVN